YLAGSMFIKDANELVSWRINSRE
ncbi:MAG: hypothetical protein QOD09_4293, partial [Bradyrhizobium sp.]|nr:hypothetical protein [Bradyrhizobium sp.]